MLTRRSSPLNTVLQQNKRMIYAFSHGRSLSPNQIFRRLILINGAFNVIFLLNIHCNVVGPPTLLYSGSSKCKIIRFCLSFVPPRSPFLFFLPAWTDTSVTERAASSERRKEEISFSLFGRFYTPTLIRYVRFGQRQYSNIFRGCETKPQVIDFQAADALLMPPFKAVCSKDVENLSPLR